MLVKLLRVKTTSPFHYTHLSKSGLTWEAHVPVDLNMSTYYSHTVQLGQPGTTMFVAMALIGPDAGPWHVSHLWSVLSALWGPVTGPRLMASAENKGTDDCSGQVHVGASKNMILWDPFVQMLIMKFIILSFHSMSLCPKWLKTEFWNVAILSDLNQTTEGRLYSASWCIYAVKSMSKHSFLLFCLPLQMCITKLLHCSLTLDEITFLYNCKLEMLSSLKVKSSSTCLIWKKMF